MAAPRRCLRMVRALCITILLSLFSGQASYNTSSITLEARVTAYAPFDNQSGICTDSDPTSTATGKTPGRLYAAVDPDKLPYGTLINIPGYGIVEIQDTGGALKGTDELRIDVYMDTHSEALKWGIKWLEVQIVDPNAMGIERW